MSPPFLLPSQVGGPTAQQAMGYEEFARCLPGFLPSTPGVKVGMADVSYSLVLFQSSTVAVITSSTSRDDSCGRGRVQGYLIPSWWLPPTQSQSHSKLPPSHQSHSKLPPTHQPHSKLPPSHSLVPSFHPVTASFQAPTQPPASFQAPTQPPASFQAPTQPLKVVEKPGREEPGNQSSYTLLWIL